MTQLQLHEIALLAGLYDEASANVTFFYRGTEFAIDYEFSEWTTPTLDEYKTALTPIENHEKGLEEPIENHEKGLKEATRDMLRLLLLPLQEQISARVEQTVVPGSTVGLDRLLRAPHVRIRVDGNGEMSVAQHQVGPTYHLKPLSLHEIELSKIACLPHIPSSEAVFNNFDPSIPSIQRKVQLPGNQRAFFKPVENGRHAEILREIRIQSAMQKHGISKIHRVASLLGLVTTGDDGLICGLLYHHIEAKSFAGIDDAKKKANTRRWRKQVSEFLNALHSIGEAWGDVNDCNILIDDADNGGNAWAIDFGGKNGTDYSSTKLDEVQRQDWVELGQVFGEENDDPRGD